MSISTSTPRTDLSRWFGSWKSPGSVVALGLLVCAGVFGGDYLTREEATPPPANMAPGMPRAISIEIAAPGKLPPLPTPPPVNVAERVGFRSVIRTTQDGRAIIRVQTHDGGDVVTFDAETGRIIDTRSPTSTPMPMVPETAES